ncbi:MAG: DNA polymerase III subunit gamma/tau [Candidatus Rariloculaceae bacterium]
MSYTVLARKWRPRKFQELVGQDHVVKALVNALSAERLHHAYLFAGTRGVGKTTLARIFAKALNCTSGVVSEPCGQCDTCLAIDEGRFVDLLEVDAASRTKVEDTRELLDNVQYMPTDGRYKVYLIDEVHMLSNHSFNALLKTLEEPPPHIKFLLATTDPQKLPATVLSRCLQFNLKRIRVREICDQLNKICLEEGVPSEPDALVAIAKVAEGSMRDALSLLDQAIAFSGGNISSDSVSTMLGSIDTGHIKRIIEGLIRGDGAVLMNEVRELDKQAPDYGLVLDQLMIFLQKIAVIQLIGGPDDDGQDEELPSLANQLDPEDVQLYYQIALQGRRDLDVCRDFRSAFEMILLRMLAFLPGSPDRSRTGVTKIVSLDESSSVDKPPKKEYELAQDDRSSAKSTPSKRDFKVVTPKVDPQRWSQLLSESEVRGAARQLAEHCVLCSHTNGKIALILATEHAHLNTDQVRGRLREALAQRLGGNLVISIEIGDSDVGTPAEIRIAGENELMREAREAISKDPAIKEAEKAFDAIVEAESIQPHGNDIKQ